MLTGVMRAPFPGRAARAFRPGHSQLEVSDCPRVRRRCQARLDSLSRAAAYELACLLADEGQPACAGALLACRHARRRWCGVARSVVAVVDHDPICVAV